ncbi:sulfurtransferase TusA family protein [Alginatibacterium sediminis]|uniref:Sulfurtransferase TusA family protein n=1 Tax=Alginatibacterium sediminis TaxID=2164068 RepID=A0A420EBK3_9ALTE|nr:sulfurtransferase TusA family protein [Alginatibacterium sediminis]RKF18055.1 sulfurtransferase TusA family protein [Alginatibacterium sediminis]
MNRPRETAKLDLQGYRCPYPLVQTKLRLKTLQSHECLLVVLDDPSSLRDIPKYFRSTGYQVIEISRASGGVDVYIQAVSTANNKEVDSYSC